MFRQPIAEQKLAGILILQEHLLPKKEMVAKRDFLPKLETLFFTIAHDDWSAADWLCVRVLGTLIEQDGQDTARMIADWVPTAHCGNDEQHLLPLSI